MTLRLGLKVELKQSTAFRYRQVVRNYGDVRAVWKIFLVYPLAPRFLEGFRLTLALCSIFLYLIVKSFQSFLVFQGVYSHLYPHTSV